MAKKFQLVDTFEQRTPTTPPETNWKLCLVCQEYTTESLVCPVGPLLSKRRDPGSGYTTMAAHLVKFDEPGKLPRTVQLHRLDEGQGVDATMVAHQAKWHKTCMFQYNNTMLRRAEKRPIASSSAFGSSDDVPGKRTRSLSSEATTSDASCFFCGESGTETLHGVATYHAYGRVQRKLGTMNSWPGSAWVIWWLWRPSTIPSVCWLFTIVQRPLWKPSRKLTMLKLASLRDRT